MNEKEQIEELRKHKKSKLEDYENMLAELSDLRGRMWEFQDQIMKIDHFVSDLYMSFGKANNKLTELTCSLMDKIKYLRSTNGGKE